MIQVLLCTLDESLDSLLRDAIGNSFLRLNGSGLPVDLSDLTTQVGPNPFPDILVIGSDGSDVAALRLATEVHQAHGTPVILVTPAAETIAFAALRAGIRDVLLPNATSTDLRAALDRTATLLPRGANAADPHMGSPEGRVVTVTSPKGGVGKTTVSTNLAVGLAQRHPHRVVIVDADVHFGDVASALNISADHTLPDLARGPAAGDSIAVKSYLTAHPTGLFVVPGSDSPTAADTVTAEDLGALIDLLRAEFDFVVVDTAPGLTQHTLAVLDRTETLVLVTSLDVPGVRGLRKEIDTLDELQLDPASRHIVLNFHDKSRGLSTADVEATIRSEVDVVLKVSTSVPLSTNQGVPLVQSGGRGEIVRNLNSLVDLVSPTAATGGEANGRVGLFGRGKS